MKYTPSIKFLILGLACLGFGFGFGILFEKKKGNTPLEIRETHAEAFSWTNPLLECAEDENLNMSGSLGFQEDVQNLVTETLAKGRANHISVYFRDLNNGPWFDIKSNEPFAPASLLKVPVLLGYLKWSEIDPALLSQEIPLLPRSKLPRRIQIYGKDTNPETEPRLRIDEMLRRMIVDSDNASFATLVAHDEGRRVERVITDLKTSTHKVDGQIQVDARGYSSFFRVLYNSSYLNRQTSELALSILSQSEFREGLRSGVPENIPIAHKYGERDYFGDRQLHDCGIVYYPSRPYVLCVMTRGGNAAQLSQVIQNVSRTVFNGIVSRTQTQTAKNW